MTCTTCKANIIRWQYTSETHHLLRQQCPRCRGLPNHQMNRRTHRRTPTGPRMPAGEPHLAPHLEPLAAAQQPVPTHTHVSWASRCYRQKPGRIRTTQRSMVATVH